MHLASARGPGKPLLCSETAVECRGFIRVCVAGSEELSEFRKWGCSSFSVLFKTSSDSLILLLLILFLADLYLIRCDLANTALRGSFGESDPSNTFPCDRVAAGGGALRQAPSPSGCLPWGSRFASKHRAWCCTLSLPDQHPPVPWPASPCPSTRQLRGWRIHKMVSVLL